MLEVEIKAALGNPAKEAQAKGASVETKIRIQEAAEKAGFIRGPEVREIDVYFNGNDRNFMKTDEALRLRTCRDLKTDAAETLITYKGPKLDQVSSTRREYETVVGSFQVMRDLLTALGYQEAFTVDKTRQKWDLPPAGGRFRTTLCLDTVAGLGEYLELETLAESESQRQAAVDELLQLLDRLGVCREHLTRKSYLELLMRL